MPHPYNTRHTNESNEFYSPLSAITPPPPSYQPEVDTLDLQDTTYQENYSNIYEARSYTSENHSYNNEYNPYTQSYHTKSYNNSLYVKGTRYEESITSLEDQPQLKNEKRLFSWMFSKRVPTIPSEEEREEYPWYKTNPLMRLGFWWLWPVLKKGYKRTLHPDDLYRLTPSLTVQEMHRVFDSNLQKLLRHAEKKHLQENHDLSNFEWPKFVIPYALFLTFKWQYMFATACLSIAFVIISLCPLVTRQLIDFVEYKYFGVYTTYNRGIGFTFLAVCLIFINGLLLNHFFHNAMIVGAQAKGLLTKVLLEKSFKLSNRSKNSFTIGKITSLMATDLSRIDLAIGFQPLILCFPIPVIIAIAILLVNIGVPSLTGIGLFFVSLIVCTLLTQILFKNREKVVAFTDQRVSLIREALNNMKIIKFYAWEIAYKMSITNVRGQEMKYLFSIKAMRNFITAYAVTLPVLSSMLSFVTLWATDSMKSPGEVFSSLSLYAILAQSIMLLPLALSSGADALIGFRRLNTFLTLPEDCSEQSVERLLDYEDKFYLGHTLNDQLQPSVIQISKAHFVYEYDTDSDVKEKNRTSSKEVIVSDTESDCSTIADGFPGLHNVDFAVGRGELVIVTGKIGSGKSSLLNAIAGQMKCTSGYVKVNGSLLSCGQPWIQNATVKENIVFGKPFDAEHYAKVIHACALIDDMKLLPAGDRTEIGERGVTLSGGQKARINLARAVYANKDIILLDDVLSAVDAKVGKHIVEECLLKLLHDKTIILATHQLNLINKANRIVYLNGDGTVDVGTLTQLKDSNKGFRRLLQFNTELEDLSNTTSRPSQAHDQQQQHEPQVQFSSTVHSSTSDLVGRTTTDEERATNSISWDVYKKYFELGTGKLGKFALPVLLGIIIIATFCQIFTNVWLSFWVQRKFKHISDHFYVGIYVMFAILTVIFTGLEFMTLEYIQNNAAHILNVKAVAKIMHAPMSFMDTTPLGRILNRFTKDTDSLDNEIGEQMRLFIFPLALLIGIMILCICYLPWFAIAVPFLAFTFIFLANFYQGSSREIKRLEATQRSLVYNNFNETLTGMSTIKAFSAEKDFIKKNDYYLNRMNEAYYLSIATQRWLCVHLDFVTCAVALIVCLLCITGQFEISASSTGLLINYVLQLVGILSLTIRSMTQVENEMNSVERIHEYAFQLPQEKEYFKPEVKIAEEWPQSGYIQFKDVYLRYRPNLPLVLKGLSVNFYPGEKVGIVGRTGAGKSSIMSALYRLTELEKGRIEIDGVNISDIGLYDLRSKLSIIPQDPVLFQGTIRKNLDPFNEHADAKLWDALKRSGLDEKFQLDQNVEDDGSNFSLGERQLIAFARALVRDSKILILDEATSSVDYETDAKIQKLVASEFKNCTILTIAHRLKTVLNYERVLVMDKGQVQEFDTPKKLFAVEDSIFRQMCQKSNITEDDFLW
ncbi:Oligomycin resistance ATP-dependent permease YOR1 [Candida viswanathii]|uniref:Oligomycin resistance ATP-dependent permease YOR1 n=1 Tax=Candida viswanathii TaxID=5486 RepID=A0A367XL77_9ASCO|nr:Oligomycin resistance ATP-dependent permease YOR1 [Candida viswanathii]